MKRAYLGLIAAAATWPCLLFAQEAEPENAAPQTAPAARRPAEHVSQIVLIRPGSSGVLADEDTIQQLLLGWEWPESVGPRPDDYNVRFHKLQSAHSSAMVGIVRLEGRGGSTDPDAMRKALDHLLGFLEGSLIEIGRAANEAWQSDLDAARDEVARCESEIEALEAQHAELTNQGEASSTQELQGAIRARQAELAAANARLGESRMRAEHMREQLARARKSLEESEAKGAEALATLSQLEALHQEQLRRAEELMATGAASREELMKVREELLQIQVQMQDRERQAKDQGLAMNLQVVAEQLQAAESEAAHAADLKNLIERALEELRSPDMKKRILELQKIARQLERTRMRQSHADQRCQQLELQDSNRPTPQVIRITPETRPQ